MAVGTHKGYVQIWDAAAGKKLSVLEGHTARVGELSGWSWTAVRVDITTFIHVTVV